MPATRRIRKTTQRFDALAQNQSDYDRAQIRFIKAKADKEARKKRKDEKVLSSNNTTPSTEQSSTSIRASNKEEQASDPLELPPLQIDYSTSRQNWLIQTEEASQNPTTSDLKISGYLNKEGPGVHSLEIEYPPNDAADSGLVPPDFQEREFYLPNGDIVIMKKHSFEFFIAKKREKKVAKFSLKKIYFNTNYETTKRTEIKILFTLAPRYVLLHPIEIRDAAFDALIKRGLI